MSNSTILGQGFVGLPRGTTAERPASPVEGYTWYNTTLQAVETFHGTDGWKVLTNFRAITASGGTVTTTVENGKTYQIHTFTSTGSNSFVVSSLGIGDAEFRVTVWGGGGSGGSVGSIHACGGAGGAGAFFQLAPTVTTYSLTVGAGGPSTGGAGVNRIGANGSNSVGFGVTCGGGQGGANNGAQAAFNPVGGTVSGTPVSSGTFIATESGQGVNYNASAGTVQGAAGGTNWSGTITAFGGGAGLPQGNGSSILGQAGNAPGGGASSTFGSNDPSYPGGNGRIIVRYRIS
jgi:hypothetical protein